MKFDGVFGFSLDSDSIKHVSPYFNTWKGLQKKADAIFFAKKGSRCHCYVVELKSNNIEGAYTQHRNTWIFIGYLLSLFRSNNCCNVTLENKVSVTFRRAHSMVKGPSKVSKRIAPEKLDDGFSYFVIPIRNDMEFDVRRLKI